MNYELAKKLKDAGFTGMDRVFGGGKWVFETVEHLKDGNLRTGNALPAPTLSELIEACGDGLQSLINNFRNEKGGWIAFTNHKDEQGERMDIWGSTPSEAVANLWLVLNNPHD